MMVSAAWRWLGSQPALKRAFGWIFAEREWTRVQSDKRCVIRTRDADKLCFS